MVICGTVGYIAPEALDGQGFSYKSDIFGVGAILFNLFTFKSLFKEKDYNALKQANKQCKLDDLADRLKRSE